MRELKRSIARSLMRQEGVAHMNRKTIELKNKEGKGTGVKVSYFSKYWRSYVNHHVDPEHYEAKGKEDRVISRQFKNRLMKRIRKNRNNRKGA